MVPEEKLRKASFVLASPRFNFLSTKHASLVNPSATSSFTETWSTEDERVELEGVLNMTTRSDGRPAKWAASSALSKELTFVIMRDALVVVS